MTDTAHPDTPRPGLASPPPRDAATLILARRDGEEPRVLMGLRGKGASFMPSKFVFPGGALDPEDHALGLLADQLDGPAAACIARLAQNSPGGLAIPLALAAIRETWEETGLRIGRPDDEMAPKLAAQAPESWRGFFDTGVVPTMDALSFVFRAITPPFRPRRFDARFFLADAAVVMGDPDDFGAASGELSHLTWVTLHEARKLALPLITEVVLAEIEEILHAPAADRPVPFFHHTGERSYFDAL
ncbi:MAG: 8-oxo-dGTP pyrophosphatase MutT (NUDIX family) [Paracoccaceae bacterium]|jgi:8-oxo-dGTP pyrophosphatase MutT (NUDIX family)